MAITNDGAILAASAVVGDGGVTLLNNANAFIGLGGGSGATAAFSASQTDLQGATKTRKAMDATYPTRASNVLTFRSTFGTADHNASVDEFGIFNSGSGGKMFSRKQDSTLGTKTNVQTWVVTVTLTVQAA